MKPAYSELRRGDFVVHEQDPHALVHIVHFVYAEGEDGVTYCRQWTRLLNLDLHAAQATCLLCAAGWFREPK